jgi:hypothetical protein
MRNFIVYTLHKFLLRRIRQGKKEKVIPVTGCEGP